MTKQCQHLPAIKSHRLLHLWKKFEDMFDGTLGTWKTTPVYLELKYKANPVWSRPYPLPKVPKTMLIKEVERLVSLWVPEESNYSKFEAPYFAQPKTKTNCVRFLSDLRNLIRQLKRKPYPMPKIREMLLNLKGFQYTTSLELNMVYYYIRLSNQASNMCTIILPWGNYWY